MTPLLLWITSAWVLGDKKEASVIAIGVFSIFVPITIVVVVVLLLARRLRYSSRPTLSLLLSGGLLVCLAIWLLRVLLDAYH
jgi:hypothetical protein